MIPFDLQKLRVRLQRDFKRHIIFSANLLEKTLFIPLNME